MRIPYSIAMCFAALTAAPAAAQSLVTADLGRIASPTSAPGDQFGFAVAVDDGWAAIGSPFDDVTVADSGSVAIFRRIGDKWIWVQELHAQGAGGNFGLSLDLAGDILVVGARYDDTLASDAGAAYVFALDPGLGRFVYLATLTDATGAGADHFGFSVAATQDWIAVASNDDDYSGLTNAGSVTLFQRGDNGTPNDSLDDSWLATQKLIPSTPQSYSYFGWCASMDATTLVVGAPYYNITGNENGVAHVFQLGSGTWSETQRLLLSTPVAYDFYGISVAVDAGVIAIGAHGRDIDAGADDRGAVYVYEPSFGTYNLTGVLIAPDRVNSDLFGFVVRVSEGWIAVDAPGKDYGASDLGAVYLARKGIFGWDVASSAVTPTVGGQGDQFGGERGLALAGEDLIVGSKGNDIGGGDAGSAFAYVVSLGHFQAYGFGDGSATACPCANDSAVGLGRGCRNSTGSGARLGAMGSDSAVLDDVRFSACNIPTFKPALLFSGPNANAGNPFGDGLKFVAGFLVRHQIVAADADGIAIFGPGLGGSSAWSAGQTRRFQAWYRDPVGGPCGSGYNLSNAFSVTFQ